MNNSEKNSYSIAALAAELGVPRTTINDWLSRYADFMDSELSGRRRLYTGRTLGVLREIAALRDQGGSGTEIADMLTRRYGIRPDVAAGPAPERAEAGPERTAPEAAGASPEGVDELDAENRFPVALRRMNENFEAFGSWMREQQTLQEAQKRRQRLTLVLVLALLAFLLAAAGAGTWFGCRWETRRRAEQDKLNAALLRQRELAARLEAKVSGLEATADESRRAAEEAARRAAAEKAELLECHRQTLTAMNSAWTAERAAQEKRWSEAREKQSAEQRQLVERLERSLRENGERLTLETERSRAEEQRLRSELEAARAALREAEEKLRAVPVPAPVPDVVPAPKSDDGVSRAEPTGKEPLL